MFARSLRCLALVGLATVAGCGGAPKGETVTGKITLNGKPVLSGQIAFIPLNNPEGSPPQLYGDIQPDGTYSVANVPPGEAIVVVESKPPEGVPAERVDAPEIQPEAKAKIAAGLAATGATFTMGSTGGKPAEKSTWFPLPKSYGDQATSPLRYTVVVGKNEYNAEMTQ